MRWVKFQARIRETRKSTANIGALRTTEVIEQAACNVCLDESELDISREIQSKRYAVKYKTVNMQVHLTAGDTCVVCTGKVAMQVKTPNTPP